MLTVIPVTPALVTQLQAAHPLVAAGFVAQYQCAQSPNLRYPELTWLVACVNAVPPTHEVSVAIDGATVGGLVVVHLPDSRIEWLCFNNGQATYTYGQVASALCAAVKAQHGIAWGIVENPVVQWAMTSADPKFVLGAGNRMQWG